MGGEPGEDVPVTLLGTGYSMGHGVSWGCPVLCCHLTDTLAPVCVGSESAVTRTNGVC